MQDLQTEKSNRQVANWLILGVAMIVVQVVLGGITRLSESGLSITEWKPITGVLPPLNDAAWKEAFDKYKVTDQFKYVHQDFSLADFKFIFFWEWFHRVWARLMGLVFLAGFSFFLLKRSFNRAMIMPMIILFLLGGLQGTVGWFMVKSGLVPEKYFVGHIELTTHFILAILLMVYTLWFALKLKIPANSFFIQPRIKNLLYLIITMLFLQLILGGFMAGTRAAISAPTWPTINGKWFPPTLFELSPFLKNIVYNKITIHFLHRLLAYLLFILILMGMYWSVKIKGNLLFSRLWKATSVIVVTQVLLGILTLLNATINNRMLWLGVLHQFTAMLLVLSLTCLAFITRKR